MQNYVAQKATSFLSDYLGTKVQIESVDIELFDKVSLNKVLIEDRHQDTMIYANKAIAGFDLWYLATDSRLCVTDITLDGAFVHLKKLKSGELNMKFFIDSFKSKKKNKKSKMSFQVDHVLLKNSRFAYDNDNKPFRSGRMDYNHLLFSNINGEFKLTDYHKGFLDVDVLSLDCKEKGGLKVLDLSGKLVADTAKAKISDLIVKLPGSNVCLDSVTADYDETWYNETSVNSQGQKIVKEKLDWKNVLLEFNLAKSTVTLNDLACFVPRLGALSDKVDISAHFKGNFGNMHLYNLVVDCDNKGLFGKMSVDFAGLPDINETYAYVNIKELGTTMPMLADLIAKFRGKPLKFPETLNRLGKIKYKGAISGYLTDLVAYGELVSELGIIRTDMQLEFEENFKKIKYNGSIGADDLKLVKLLGRKNQLDNASFRIKSAGIWSKDNGFACSVKGDISKVEYRDYKYKNINIDGYVKGQEFDGQININDENLDLDFSGSFNYTRALQTGAFSLNVDHIQPHNLNLLKGYENLSLSGDMSFDFRGDVMSNNNRADIYINNLTIDNLNKHLAFNDMEAVSVVTPGRDSIVFTSDLLDMKMSGNYKLTTLVKSLKHAAKKYMPVLFAKGKNDDANVKYDNEFDVRVDDVNLNKLFEVLGSNVRVGSGAYLDGHFSDKTQLFNADVLVPLVKFGKKQNRIDSTHITLDNKYGMASVRLLSKYNGHTGFGFMADAHDDVVSLTANWDNPSLTYGSLTFDSHLYREKQADTLSNIMASIDVEPAYFSINGDRWDMHSSHINTDFKKFDISGFELNHDDQYIKIDGLASKNLSDSIDVGLKGVRLSYIMDLIGVNAVDLDAMINGKARVYGLFGPMVLNIDADADDFSFNNSIWGDVKLKSEWDSQTKRLHASGRVFNDDNKSIFDNEGILSMFVNTDNANKSDTTIVLDGEYFPGKDSLEFFADISSLKLDFIQKYLDGILDDVTGDASGNLRIFGSLKKILMEGDIMVNNGKLKVDFLNTAYHFSDTIKIRKDKFIFDNVDVRDAENHSAMLNGEVRHDYYKNIMYNISILPHNLLAMDLKSGSGNVFYGKAYATGNVRIFGYPGSANFNIQARTEPNTKIYLSLANGSKVTENTFITYVDRNAVVDTSEVDDNEVKPAPSHTNMKVSLTVEATPDADITLLTSSEGDMLKATGSGNIRMEYDTKSDLQLFGNYEVESGSYTFTLQNVIRRDFSLRNGGTIKWSGNPSAGILNLDALYYVQSASLLDILDESDLEGLGRTIVPVNCLLNLTGNLTQPNIKFDLELPSDKELQRKVKNIVNTDEMMNREILSLLVLGSFYRPEYIQNSSSTGVGNQMASVLTSTVSGQLNSMLSQISDKFNVGVNAVLGNGEDFSQGGEYEVALMYRPNNRLVINSNLGYRNDYINEKQNGSNFIGDVDIEYKLTKNGKLRAKAYTHSADNYYYNISGSAKTTQGVGLLYREDFNTFKGLWRRYFSKDSKNNQQKRDSILLVQERERISRIDSMIDASQKKAADDLTKKDSSSAVRKKSDEEEDLSDIENEEAVENEADITSNDDSNDDDNSAGVKNNVATKKKKSKKKNQ